jgi:hypothetical protein
MTTDEAVKILEQLAPGGGLWDKPGMSAGRQMMEAARTILANGYAPEGMVLVPEEVLKDCADELEAWVNQYYTPDTRTYPSEERRYQRDIAPVISARTLLAAAHKEKP